MNPSLDSILGHAINTLPDSLRDRKELLGALLRVTPLRHPFRDRIHLLIVQLETHEQNQLNLALEFKGSSKSATAANGQPK